MAPPARLDYGSCTCVELRQFIKSRGGVPKKKSKKLGLIATLERLDDDPGVFRFLDLPAEMKNDVYARLVPEKPGSSRRSTSILRVSKQVNSEASGVLYGVNKLEITVKLSDSADQLWQKVLVSSKRTRSRLMKLPDLHDSSKDWPAHILKFHNIGVTFKLSDSICSRLEDATHARGANHVLYNLASFLGRSKVLKNIEVNWQVEGLIHEISGEDLRQALWPLSRFHPLAELRMSGVPDHVKTFIQAEAARMNKLEFDILAEAQALMNKAIVLKDAMEAGHHFCEQYTDRVSACMHSIRVVRQTAEYMTEASENKLKSQLEEFRAILDSPETRSLIRSIDDTVHHLRDLKKQIQQM